MLSMSRSQDLALLPICCSIYVSTSSTPAAFPDSNMFVDTVYIDFSKAFDTVSYRKLLHKLTNYGITGNISQWFSSFLSDRKQRVKIVYSSYSSAS